MKRPIRSSDAGVVDVLFAVALGEGFFAAMYGIREEVVAGQFLLLGTGGQTLSRVLLGFVIIIVSWLFYRRAVVPGRNYPPIEFAIDIVTIIAYMALLSFADWPIVFYPVIAVIWLMYLLARIASRLTNTAYLVFGLTFVLYFVIISVSASWSQANISEWLRIILATVGVSAYRFLDVKLRTKFGFDSSAD